MARIEIYTESGNGDETSRGARIVRVGNNLQVELVHGFDGLAKPLYTPAADVDVILAVLSRCICAWQPEPVQPGEPLYTESGKADETFRGAQIMRSSDELRVEVVPAEAPLDQKLYVQTANADVILAVMTRCISSWLPEPVQPGQSPEPIQDLAA